MANYDTCMHFDAIGPGGPATSRIQVRLASSAGPPRSPRADEGEQTALWAAPLEKMAQLTVASVQD